MYNSRSRQCWRFHDGGLCCPPNVNIEAIIWESAPKFKFECYTRAASTVKAATGSAHDGKDSRAAKPCSMFRNLPRGSAARSPQCHANGSRTTVRADSTSPDQLGGQGGEAGLAGS